MSNRKFVYISIVVMISVCVASHFFIPLYLIQPFIPDIRVLPEKAVSRGNTDSTIKPFRFVITVEGNTLTVCVNGEEQFRHTPQDIAKDSYSIGFWYPAAITHNPKLSDLQIWNFKK